MRFLTPALLAVAAVVAEITLGPVAGLLVGILCVISWEAACEDC